MVRFLNAQNHVVLFHHAKEHAALSDKFSQVRKHICTEGHWDLIRQERNRFGFGSLHEVKTPKMNIRIPLLSPDKYAVLTIDVKSSQIDRIAVLGDKDTLFDLVLYGAYKPDSLIGKLIASLGNYRLDILKRAKAGFKTELHDQKLKITVFSQRLFALFLPFERLIHNPNCFMMNDLLADLEAQINFLYLKLQSEPYGDGLKAMLNGTNKALIDAIKELGKKIRSIEDCKEVLILSARIINRQGQTLNRAITEDNVHSMAILRGNLNNYFEDNLQITNKFNYDFDNPILPEHQGLLSDAPLQFEKPSQGVVLSDLDLIRDLDAFALILDDIRQPLLKRRADLTIALEICSDATELRIVTNPKWHGVGYSLGQGAKRFSLETLYLLKDTIEIPGKIIGLITDRLERSATPVAEARTTVSGAELTDLAIDPYIITNIVASHKKPHSSWYSRLGRLAINLAHRVSTKPLIENATGAYVSLRKKIAELDSYLDDDRALTPSGLFFSSKEPREGTVVSGTSSVEVPVGSIPVVEGARDTTSAITPHEIPRILHSPYELNKHGSNTLIAALAHGVESFTDTFVHNIYGKHPILGALYSVLSASSAGAVWFGLGGHEFAGAMLKLSSAVSSGTTFGGVSTGSTVAQISVAIAESMIHGKESWIGTVLSRFSENPATITAGLISGFAVGYVITELAHIPIISHYLDEELGTIPEIAQFFAGLKIAAVSFEIFLPPAQRKILKAEDFPEIKSELQRDDTLLLNVLKNWHDLLPFISDDQKKSLEDRMSTTKNPKFERYQTRLKATIRDLIDDGTLLKFGDSLAYLSKDKKADILKACKNHKQHQQLDELLYPHAKRSVVGETAFRILRPPVRLLGAVCIAAKAVTWDSRTDKVKKTLRFAGKEIARVVVHDIGEELVGDTVKSTFNLARTATKATARVIKSSVFVAPLSFASKSRKILVLASRGFSIKPASPDSLIEISGINRMKKDSGDAADSIKTKMWFNLRRTWDKTTTRWGDGYYNFEHWMLHGGLDSQKHLRSTPTPSKSMIIYDSFVDISMQESNATWGISLQKHHSTSIQQVAAPVYRSGRNRVTRSSPAPIIQNNQADPRFFNAQIKSPQKVPKSSINNAIA